MKNLYVLPLLFILIMAAVSGCSKEYSASGIPAKTTPKEDSFNLVINFAPMVDTLLLNFDSTYTNYWDEDYKVSAFKFYVSNFDLINTDSGRAYHLDTAKYFLVDAADSTTWTVKLLATPFTYDRISFLIGIDSAHNINNSKKDAFDPAKGMFWSASAGYIMAKFQGASESGTAFDYQIGGFTGPDNVLRKPTLLFPYGQFLTVSATAGSQSIININADAGAWFYNPRQIKIETTPTCTLPGPLAHSISENYSNMFSVDTIMAR